MNKIKENLIVIGLYFIITCIFTFPLMFHLSTYGVFDDADAYLMQWNLAQNVHKLSTNPLDLFNANYFYPHNNTLAYSEHHFLSSLLAFPIIKVFDNPLLALNLLILFSYVISGWATYLLVYRLTKNKLASFLAGLIFAFAPFRAIHFSRLHVVSTQYLPFVLLFLDKIFSEKPRTKNFAFFTLFLILQSFTSLHLTFFILVVVFFMILFNFLINHSLFNKKVIFLFLVSFTVLFLINLPLILPYLQLGNVAGSNRYISIYYSPTILDYLKISPAFNYLFGYPKTLEKNLYPGFAVLLLFIISIYFLFKVIKDNRDAKLNKKLYIFFIILIVTFLLSFGPTIRFSDSDQGIVGPYLLLEKIVGGETGFRAAGRFFIVSILIMAIIIGYGMSKILSRFKSSFRKNLFVVFISLVIMCEYFIIPPFSPIRLTAQEKDRATSSVYDWIAQQPGDFAILELPIGKDPLTETRYIYFSIFHWKNLVNGYSGHYPREYFALENAMKGFPSEEALKMIEYYNPKYVIVHFDELEPPFLKIKPTDLEGMRELKSVYSTQNVSVYQFQKSE